MRLKSVLVTLAVAAVAAPLALAAPPPGKGKPPTSGPNCKPGVAVVIRGTLANEPGASPTLPFDVQVQVTGTNRHGAAWKKATQPISVTVTAATKVRRTGKKTLSDLKRGDRASILARACKADLASDATPQLWAMRIVAQPATAGAEASS